MKRYSLSDYAIPDFPLYVWKQHYRVNKEINHSHDCNEIVFVLSGSGITRVNEHCFPIIKGDLYIMNVDDIHAYESQNKLSFVNVMFKNELFSPDELYELHQFPSYSTLFEKNSDSLSKKYSLVPPYSEKVEQLMNTIEKELKEKRIGWQIAARAAFMDFMVFILRCISNRPNVGAAEKPRPLDGVSRVVDFIHLHYHHKLTLAQLAKVGGISVNYLGELFKKETGMTVFEYIGKLRVDKARAEIDNTSRGLSEIAVSLGFYDSSYFCRSFRKYTGLSPREYEKIIRRQR